MHYQIEDQYEFEDTKVVLIRVHDLFVDSVDNVHVTLSVCFTNIDFVQSLCCVVRNKGDFSLGMLKPVGGNPLRLSFQAVDLIQQLLVGTLCVVIYNYHVEQMAPSEFHISCCRDNFFQLLFLENGNHNIAEVESSK